MTQSQSAKPIQRREAPAAKRPRRSFCAAVLASALFGLAAVPSTGLAAEPPPVLWTAGENCEVPFPNAAGCSPPDNRPGDGAGETTIPRGIATDPDNGHLYVADGGNSRISEFDAWGRFVRAFGWDVAPEGAPGDTPADEMEVCTTICKEGAVGSAAGHISGPQGVAIDSAGDLYVSDSPCCTGNYRVNKFDLSTPVPTFEWAIGTGVDKGPNHAGDICTAQFVAEGDECGKGGEDAGPGQFSGWPISSFIAVGPDDTLYVGDKDRIQEFDTAGAYQGQISFTGSGAVGELPEPGQVGGLAADPESGDLYFSYESDLEPYPGAEALQPDVYRLDAGTGEILDVLPLDNPGAIAVGAQGEVSVIAKQVFISGGNPSNRPLMIAQFDAAGNQAALFGNGEFTLSTGIAMGSACYEAGSAVYVSNANFNVSFVRAYGQPPDKLDGEGNLLCPAPPVAPTVEEQTVVAADQNSTTVQAKINPHFWPDATYYVQWGTGKCSEGGCTNQTPVAAADLGGGIVQTPLSTAKIALAGLQPDTAYRYRFVAQSSGGGPSFGAERQFTSYPAKEAEPEAGCANRNFRSGPAAFLADCRAYEQVSPIDKSGSEIAPGIVLARSDGEAVVYNGLGAFGDARQANQLNPYLARRGGGWLSTGIAPEIDPTERLFIGPVLGIAGDFGRRFVVTNAKLGPEGAEGEYNALNYYVYDPATDSHLFVATPHDESPPPNPQDIMLFTEYAGAAADGSGFVFGSHSRLDAVPPPPVAKDSTTSARIYHFDVESEQLSYLGVLPDESLDPKGSAVAGAFAHAPGAAVSYRSVSADGERVYWTNDGGFTPLYLRVHPGGPASARLHGAATGTGDLIGAMEATGTLVSGSTTVSSVVLKSGGFAVGQTVTATGIPAGTTIAAVEAGKLQLSKAATTTKAGVTLTGVASEVVTNLTTATGAFAPGQEIVAPGIPGGTTILAATPTSLTLSAKASATEAGAELSATSPCTEPEKACTYAVSKRESDGSAQEAAFWGASVDGSLAYLTSDAGLTEDASAKGADLYRYDAAADELTDLTPDSADPDGADVRRVLGVSEDGAYVYFIATGNLAAGATGSAPKIYAWHGGDIRLLATLPTKAAADLAGGELERELWRISPDGRYLGFLFGGEIGSPHPYPDWPHRQAYLYDYGADELSCASCPRGGFARGDARLRLIVTEVSSESLFRYRMNLTRNVTDAGQFFFESPDRLLLRDTNQKVDVYEYQDGKLSLLSSGQDDSDSFFGDATPDGSDAFFVTRESLVGQDTDPFYDLYDARVGGGLAAQAASAGASCQGDGCQGPFTAPPAGQPGAGTSVFSGPGDPAPKRKKKKKRRRAKKHRHRSSRSQAQDRRHR
jgi:hypothetical protein